MIVVSLLGSCVLEYGAQILLARTEQSYNEVVLNCGAVIVVAQEEILPA